MYDLFASPSVTGPVIPVQSEADIPLANEQIELLNDDVTLILPKDATPTQIDEFEDKIEKINPDYKTCQNADNVNLTESCNATFIVIPLVEEPSELIEIRQASTHAISSWNFRSSKIFGSKFFWLKAEKVKNLNPFNLFRHQFS